MYGVGGSRTGQDWTYAAGDPVSPIGPDVATQDAWWFRGPGYRALAPPAGAVTELPAGGTIMLEIACREQLSFCADALKLTVSGTERHRVDCCWVVNYRSGLSSRRLPRRNRCVFTLILRIELPS